MCEDCDNHNGNTPLVGPQGPPGPPGPIGPTGPTGNTGPGVILSGTSGTSDTIGTGIHALITEAGLGFTTGQTVVVTSYSVPTASMTGTVVSYTGTDFTVDVTSTTGTGTHADWVLAISGPKGSTGTTGAAGSQGVSAFTELTANAVVSSTPNQYDLTVANSSFLSIGQMVYIEAAGYYSIVANDNAGNITIEDPLYTGNSTAALLDTATLSCAGPIGETGATGASGVSFIIGAYTLTVAGIPSTKTIFTNSTGNPVTLLYTGSFTISATDTAHVTIIDNSTVPLTFKGTIPPSITGHCYVTIPVVGTISLLNGDSFTLATSISDVGVSGSIDSISVNFIYS